VSEIRYLQFIGAGLNEVNRQSEALYLFDRAIELAQATPGAGFPYMAYESETQALTTPGKGSEAATLLAETLARGRAEQKAEQRSAGPRRYWPRSN